MKYKTLTWEEGETEERNKCVYATIGCVPNWFMQLFFNRKPFKIDVYGEKDKKFVFSPWKWFYVKTGKEVPNYGTWESRDQGLYGHLERHVERMRESERAEAILDRIYSSKKIK